MKSETIRFRSYKKLRLLLFLTLLVLPSLKGRAGDRLPLDEIVLDIYNALTEIGDVNYEQLQTDLYALHESPIDLNNTNDEELSQLYFLSPRQIDDLLSYADKHPFESLYELRLIPSLTDFEIRDLLPFVRVGERAHEQQLYAREVFHRASHEILTRVDARNIEDYTGTDPMYVQTRYRFDYRRRIIFGAQLRRPAGTGADGLQYGAYLQLRDIAPHLHSLVAGNFQASFGQGLVLAPVFHAGKSAYVHSVGQAAEGLRYYGSVDGAGLHGAGATLRWNRGKATRLDVTALYSMTRANDSTWHHLVGANMTVRHKKLEVQLTAIENIWTDSVRPYTNAAYNRHYFRGYNQAVLGASARYNHGWFDAFCEIATSQNSQKWGIGVLAGSRFYPADGISLLALYRYYSPWFDNPLGYAFSETSRMGDENGGYIGFDITRWKRWRVNGYADVFYFSGPKFGIPQSGTIGYDAALEIAYRKNVRFQLYDFRLRVRARKKGDDANYSTRFQFDWTQQGWNLRTTADFNFSSFLPSAFRYGFSLAQDIGYDFQSVPLGLRTRLQFFDARDWDNRIYLYEHDVLYAYSIPAVYGFGGRAYVCLSWQPIPLLTLYFRASETLYAKQWAAPHDRPLTRTDLHLLLRIKL